MSHPSRSKAQRLLDSAIPFLGVGAGAVTVILFHNPVALLPRPPYWPWLFAAGALAALAMILAVGLEDGWEEDDAVDPAERWRAAVAAYVVGVIASVAYLVSVALIRHLEAAL
jgi:hypothetical protein